MCVHVCAVFYTYRTGLPKLAVGKGTLCFGDYMEVMCISVFFHIGMSLVDGLSYSGNQGLSPVANPVMSRTNGGDEQNPAEPGNSIIWS